jgi:hypothetical protein
MRNSALLKKSRRLVKPILQPQIADSSSRKAVNFFIRVHNETLSVVAMRVSNEDRSPVGNQSLRRSPNSNRLC